VISEGYPHRSNGRDDLSHPDLSDGDSRAPVRALYGFDSDEGKRIFPLPQIVNSRKMKRLTSVVFAKCSQVSRTRGYRDQERKPPHLRSPKCGRIPGLCFSAARLIQKRSLT
jgi:hypothetical protein